MSDRLFDVIVVGINDNKVESVIGRNLTDKQAEKREETGLDRINLSYAFVAIVDAGSQPVGSEYKVRP